MESSKLASCTPDSRQCHYDAGLVVAGYLWKTKSLGIVYGGKLRIPPGLTMMPPGFEASHGLYVAHGSSWGTAPHPLGGYVIMYCNGAVDWSAKLIKIVPDSTCEAETALASRAAKATCFIRGLLRFHKRPVAAATPALGDNKAMYTLEPWCVEVSRVSGGVGRCRGSVEAVSVDTGVGVSGSVGLQCRGSVGAP